MDAASTVQIPRRLIAAIDARNDTESTMIIPPGSLAPPEGWGPSPAR